VRDRDGLKAAKIHRGPGKKELCRAREMEDPEMRRTLRPGEGKTGSRKGGGEFLGQGVRTGREQKKIGFP